MKKKGSDGHGDLGLFPPGHGLQDEEVEAERRGDLGDLDQQHDEDAEPHQVEAGLLTIGMTIEVVSTIIDTPSSAVPSRM